MIGTLIAGGSLLTSIIGNVAAGRRMNEVGNNIRKKQKDLQNWFDTESNTSYLNTDQGKSVIQTLKNNMKDQSETEAQTAVVTGATPEAQIAKTSERQKNYADAITKLAGYGTQRKDMLRREYNGRKDNLDNQYNDFLAGKAGSSSNLASNAANTLSTVMQPGVMGGLNEMKFSDIFKS